MKSNKKVYGVLLAFLAITLLWCSCSVEQSTYSIEDISGKATIKGRAYYNQGQKIENGIYKEDLLPVKNQKIYVDIANASFGNKDYYTSNKGYMTFETTTDENGNYEIEIPATSLKYGTEIEIYSEGFIGKQTIIKSIENGAAQYESIEAIYTYSRTTYSVKANETLLLDIKFQGKERNAENKAFIGTTSVKVIVGVGEIEVGYYYSYGDPYFNFREGIEASLTVTYNKNNWSLPRFDITYTGKTNQRGEIEFNVLLQEESEYLEKRLSIPSFRENRFFFPVYNYQTQQYDLEIYTGTYHLYNNGHFVDSQEDGENYLYLNEEHIIRSRMVFEADPGQTDNYDYQRYGWDYISIYNN